MCTIKAQTHTQNYYLHCSPLNYMVSLIYVAPLELKASTVKNLGPDVMVHVTLTAPHSVKECAHYMLVHQLTLQHNHLLLCIASMATSSLCVQFSCIPRGYFFQWTQWCCI